MRSDLGKLVLLIFFSPYFLHWWPSLCGAKVSTFLMRFSFLPRFHFPPQQNKRKHKSGTDHLPIEPRQQERNKRLLPGIDLRLVRARRRRHCSRWRKKSRNAGRGKQGRRREDAAGRGEQAGQSAFNSEAYLTRHHTKAGSRRAPLFSFAA